MKRIFVALSLLIPTVATARPFRPDEIPDAPDSCETCHVAGQPRSNRNLFGMQVRMHLESDDIEPNLSQKSVVWSTLCPLDADGDSFSNGAELGDPNCTWMINDPRTTAVSDPADALSTPAPVNTDGGVDAGADGGVMMDASVDAGMMDSGMDAGMMDSGADPDAGMDAGPMDSGATDTGTTMDAGTDAGASADTGSGGNDDPPPTASGGDGDDDGCSAHGANPSSAGLLLLALALGFTRLRRRTS